MSNENENEKIINFEVLKKQLKAEEIKRNAAEAIKRGYNTVVEHPVETASAATALSMVLRKVLGYSKVAKEERRRKTEFYEHSSGKYAKAKRPLTPKQQLEAERRHKGGETWSEILYDMGLLR